MAALEVPPHPRLDQQQCREVPHEGHVELSVWDQRWVLRHKLTGEVINGACQGVASLHFADSGLAYLSNGPKVVWVNRLLKYCVFESLACGRLFVFRKDRNERLWLESMQKQRQLLYPADDDFRGLQSDMLSILQTNEQYYFRLKPFSRLNRSDLSKKLRRTWVPSFEEKTGEKQKAHVRWGPRNKQHQGDNSERAHDIFASTFLLLYILVLQAAQGTTDQRKPFRELLVNVLGKWLPPSMSCFLNEGEQELHIVRGRTSFRDICQERSYRQRTKRIRRKLPVEEQHIADILVTIYRWKAYDWLLQDLLRGLVPHLEAGVTCQNYPGEPADSHCFETEGLDWRDPNVRQKRLQKALEKRKATKGTTALQKRKDRAKFSLARSLINPRQKRLERSQYFMSLRRQMSSCTRLHVAFDGSRVGGRKWNTFCALDASSGASCWPPPVRFRDGGYRNPSELPSEAEAGRFDQRLLEFLEEMRSRERSLQPTKVIETTTRCSALTVSSSEAY